MMITLSLICDRFMDEEKYQIVIVQTIDEKSRRFRFVKDVSAFGHVIYHVLNYDESIFAFSQPFSDYVKTISGSAIDTCIIFNKLAYIAFFSAKLLSAKGTKIVLAPDGAAAYATISRFTPRWSLFVSINTHKFLWANGILKIYFYFPTLVYGAMKEISELWVQYPAHVDRRTGKPIRQIDILKSPASVKAARRFFGYTEAIEEPCIFYTNQPFRDNRINDFEIMMLKDLSQRYPNRPIYIKLHPTTYDSHRQKLEQLDHIRIIESTIPAEVIIATLRESIVISFWSTAMLIDNPSCSFFWLFPLLKNADINLHKMTIKSPSDHLKVVNTIEDIRETAKR